MEKQLTYKELSELNKKSFETSEKDEKEKIKVFNPNLPHVKIAFLGGVQEIGRSCSLYMFGDDYVLVDIGVKYERKFGTTYYFLPDFNFIKQNVSKIKAIIITHSHEDHIGGLARLLLFLNIDIPIYIGRFGSEFLNLTLEKDFPADLKVKVKNNIRVVKDKTRINFSSGMSMNFIQIQHTTPNSFMINFVYKDIKIMHTGDWKFDLTPLQSNLNWKSLLEPACIGSAHKGVHALITDSTRTEESGFSVSEKVIIDSLEKLFIDKKENRIILTTFASNANRLIEITKLATKYSRKVFLFGYSMKKNLTAAIKSGMIKTKNFWQNMEKNQKFKHSETLILASGPQGDLNGSLSKMAEDKHKYIKLNEKDIVVFSSDIIPGNEENVTNCIKKLLQKKVQVIHRCLDKDYKNFHVSGHGYKGDMHLLMNLLKPKFFLPVHGNYNQMFLNRKNALEFGMLDENIILSDNGKIVTITDEKVYEESFNFSEYITDENNWELPKPLINLREKIAANGFFNFVVKSNKIDSFKSFFVQSNFTNIDLLSLNKQINITTKNEEEFRNIFKGVFCKYFNCLESTLPYLNVEFI